MCKCTLVPCVWYPRVNNHASEWKSDSNRKYDNPSRSVAESFPTIVTVVLKIDLGIDVVWCEGGLKCPRPMWLCRAQTLHVMFKRESWHTIQRTYRISHFNVIKEKSHVSSRVLRQQWKQYCGNAKNYLKYPMLHKSMKYPLSVWEQGEAYFFSASSHLLGVWNLSTANTRSEIIIILFIRGTKINSIEVFIK